MSWAVPAVLVASVTHLMASVCAQDLLLAWARAAVDVSLFCSSQKNISVLKEREKWPRLDGFITPAEIIQGWRSSEPRRSSCEWWGKWNHSVAHLLGVLGFDSSKSWICSNPCGKCMNSSSALWRKDSAGWREAQLSPGCGRCWTNSPRGELPWGLPKEMWVTWLEWCLKFELIYPLNPFPTIYPINPFPSILYCISV